LEIVTSISSYLSKLTSDVLFHRKEWVEDIEMDYGNPSSLCHRPYPFLAKLWRPTKPKWGAKFGPEVVCMVVPPVPFDMVCDSCGWREGKVNVVIVTTFSQNCCAGDNPCRFLWQGLPLPNAIDPVFTDLEMASHGNPPVVAAAGAETAATNDDEETAAAAAAAGAVDKTTATVKGVAELQLGGLPRRPHRLLGMPHTVPFAPPPYTGNDPTWRPHRLLDMPMPPTWRPHRLLDMPLTVPLAPPPYTGKDPTFPPLDGNLPLSATMAREAMDIVDEAIADEATAAAALETMRQVDLPIVGKKKRNRPIAALAPPAPPAPDPTRRSTRATIE
jgi:hypothetical protein